MGKSKWGKVFILASALFCVYEAGKIIGHIDCIHNVMDKYSDEIADTELTSKVSKHITITVHKKEKA